MQKMNCFSKINILSLHSMRTLIQRVICLVISDTFLMFLLKCSAANWELITDCLKDWLIMCIRIIELLIEILHILIDLLKISEYVCENVLLRNNEIWDNETLKRIKNFLLCMRSQSLLSILFCLPEMRELSYYQLRFKINVLLISLSDNHWLYRKSLNDNSNLEWKKPPFNDLCCCWMWIRTHSLSAASS